MARFYKYINEQSDEEIEQIKNALKKRCIPFLKEFDAPVYRGYKKGISGLMSRKVTRKDRKPRFVPEDLHNDLDNLLYKMYGWYPRSNGIFTGSKNLAQKFGQGITNTYIFFPVGDYEYIWTERYHDIYSLYDELTEYAKELELPKDLRKGKEEYIGDSNIIDSYKEVKKQLLDLIRSGVYNQSRLNKMVENNKTYEAIFNCESYYLVDNDVFIEDDIKEFMRKF